MNWLLKFAGVKAYAAFAAILAILAALWFAQVAGLRAEVSDAKAATALAEKNLSDRVAAEATALAGLLGACVLLAIFAGSALVYTDHTAAWLAEPQAYAQAVLSGGGR